MASSLEQFSKLTEVFADTADFLSIRPYKVTEATTNPVIMYQAATSPQYQDIFQKGITYGVKTGKTMEEKIENAMDMIYVLFGEQILTVVKNKVHIQLDPRLAFNVEKSVARILKLAKLFEGIGISNRYVSFKIPSTWEGIQAARILENNHKVTCNMTALFSMTQAAASAEAGASYISPFTGGINIWYNEHGKATGKHEGVEALKRMQSYMRKFGFKTKILGAYFLSTDDLRAIAGCDSCTIPINLLEQFAKETRVVTDMMDKDPSALQLEKMSFTEAKYRSLMNEDPMTTELVLGVLKNFGDHYVKLEKIVKGSIEKFN